MDGVIFDVDGTIWDATDSVLLGFNEGIRANLGEDAMITREQLQSVFGKTMDVIYEMLFPQLSKEEQKRVGEICIQHEDEALIKYGGNVYPGIPEVIKKVKKTYPIYIVSNCQLGYIDKMLEFTGLGSYITDFLCYGDTLQPKSYTIKELMRKNNLKDVVYIGDTIGDQQACTEAEVPFIYASYGFGDLTDCKYTVTQASEIPDMVNQVIKDLKL